MARSPALCLCGAVSEVIPVDLHIRGCPPEPIALLKGLITLRPKLSAAYAKQLARHPRTLKK